MEIYFAGTGTSHGIPVIGCDCAVCRSKDPKDTRSRSSVFITGSDGTSIVIDAGPDFRFQALKRNLCRLDALLLTHSHADHVHGIDDLRVFAHTKAQDKSGRKGSLLDTKRAGEKPLAVYANRDTIRDIKERFAYIFPDSTPNSATEPAHDTSGSASQSQQGGGKPLLCMMEAENFCKTSPLSIGCLNIVPVPIKHGILNVCGWKITEKKTEFNTAGACKTDTKTDAAGTGKTEAGGSGNANIPDTASVSSFAYLTDCSFIEDSSINLVRGVQHLVIDALREKEHPTHLHFAESICYAQKIGAHHTWFTHISHDSSHRDIIDWIRRNCPPGFSCPQDLSSTNGAGCTQIIYTERTQHTGANANTIASAFDGLVLYC